MLLATTKAEDVDRFIEVFSTTGAEKRKLHGSKGSAVFRDPTEEDRVWTIFDWDAEGWKDFKGSAVLAGTLAVGSPLALLAPSRGRAEATVLDDGEAQRLLRLTGAVEFWRDRNTPLL